MKLVIDGKRNLTNESNNKISKGFQLKKKEHDFFEKLVFMNQASSHEIRNFYYKQMLSVKEYTKANLIAKASYEYYSKWYYPAIREIVTFGNQKYTAATIATLLKPEITEKQAQDALNHLIELGMIKKDENGFWAQCEQHISTGPEVRSFIVAQYHREMLELAIDSIERFSSEEKDITSLTFSMDSQKLQELKQLLAGHRNQVRSKFVDDGPADQVFQLNIQLYPLTERDGNGGA